MPHCGMPHKPTLFMMTMGCSPLRRALPSTNFVCDSAPSLASTTSNAPSTMPSTLEPTHCAALCTAQGVDALADCRICNKEATSCIACRVHKTAARHGQCHSETKHGSPFDFATCNDMRRHFWINIEELTQCGSAGWHLSV